MANNDSPSEIEKHSSNKKKFPTQLPFTPYPDGDLANHVSADWWKILFDELYLKTDGDNYDGEDDTITKSEIDLMIKISGFTPSQHILDLCCGQGRHSFELARRGFTKVDGLDYSDYLINIAKQRAVSSKLPVIFTQGDARQIPFPDGTFDVIMLLANSFGYFEDKNDDIAVLKEVYRALKPGGYVLLDITDGTYIKNNYNKTVLEWIDEDVYVYRQREIKGDRLVAREAVCSVDKGLIRDHFYAERLYAYDDIKQSLLSTNFKELKYEDTITHHHEYIDWGMLAQRMIIRGFKI